MKRILLVCRDSVLRAGIEGMLARRAYDITTVAEPGDALRLIEETRPDVVLVEPGVTLGGSSASVIPLDGDTRTMLRAVREATAIIELAPAA